MNLEKEEEISLRRRGRKIKKNISWEKWKQNELRWSTTTEKLVYINISIIRKKNNLKEQHGEEELKKKIIINTRIIRTKEIA